MVNRIAFRCALALARLKLLMDAMDIARLIHLGLEVAVDFWIFIRASTTAFARS